MPGSSTTLGWAGARDDAPAHVAFRNHDAVGTQDYQAYAAQWLAYVLPYRRFIGTLTDADARLGAGVDRYSLTAVDFHLLLFAGFDRRTTILELRSRGIWRSVVIRLETPGGRRSGIHPKRSFMAGGATGRDWPIPG
jgi:hypothetical protein